jgi:hypothetical protein
MNTELTIEFDQRNRQLCDIASQYQSSKLLWDTKGLLLPDTKLKTHSKDVEDVRA